MKFSMSELKASACLILGPFRSKFGKKSPHHESGDKIVNAHLGSRKAITEMNLKLSKKLKKKVFKRQSGARSKIKQADDFMIELYGQFVNTDNHTTSLYQEKQ